MTTRNRFRTPLAALVGLSAAAIAATAAAAGEEKVAFDKLPGAVKEAVKKHFPEAKVRGAASEVEDGKTTYEVELTVEGRSVNVAMNAEGKILEVEKEITVGKLPRAVRKRLAKKYPGAKIEKAEQITRGIDGPVRYEVVIKTEVVLTAKGKIVQATEDEDEDDDKPSAKAGKKEHEDEDDDDEDEDDD